MLRSCRRWSRALVTPCFVYLVPSFMLFIFFMKRRQSRTLRKKCSVIYPCFHGVLKRYNRMQCNATQCNGTAQSYRKRYVMLRSCIPCLRVLAMLFSFVYKTASKFNARKKRCVIYNHPGMVSWMIFLGARHVIQSTSLGIFFMLFCL